MMKLTEALIPNSRWFVLVRQRKMVGGEKNLKKKVPFKSDNKTIFMTRTCHT